MYRITVLLNIENPSVDPSRTPSTTIRLDKPFESYKSSGMGLEKIFEAKTPTERICILPPYPEKGGYVVVNSLEAKPGDSFKNVTLIQYKTDGRNRLVDVNTFTCSFGEWYLKVMRYEFEDDSLAAGSCPLICANSSDVRVSEKIKKPPTVAKEETPQPSKLCKMPPYPPNGLYEVTNKPESRPGDLLAAARLLYRCKLRYKIMWGPSIVCFNGIWYGSTPKCVQEAPSSTEGSSTMDESNVNAGRCEVPEYPENGQHTVVNIQRAVVGETYETLNLNYSCNGDTKIVGDRKVYCISGAWSGKRPKCVRCGFITEIGAVNASSTVLTWHAGVYDKTLTPYDLVCGGTIVATNLIVSAASCVWSEAEETLPASRFTVAVGKLYRGWDDQRDMFAQKADVERIVIPSKFRGALTRFQDDIALLFLATPIHYNDYVAPICIDFGTVFDEQQLKEDNVGKLGAWGSSNDDSEESSLLQVKELAYVEINKCITDASPEFRSFITSDKICAGDTNGTELCKSYRGGGLAFPVTSEGGALINHHLRGVLAAGPESDETCNRRSVATFTQITAHENFLKFHFKSAIW